jgi:polysaccharide biosynthesis/export protein
MYLLSLSLIFTVVLAGCVSSDLYSNTYIYQDKFPSPTVEEQANLQKLAELWQLRAREQTSSDYVLSSGDSVEISVAAIEELRSRTLRIARDGTIALPFIGKVQVAGLTREELEQHLTERLQQYMYKPRVVVFVREYQSRQVAVLGAVTKPGLYSLTGSSDTLLDMLSQAGGMQQGADPKIYFIPAEPADKKQVAQITATLPASLLQQDAAPLILKRTEPIQIDMKQVALGGNQQYLALPVWPGDVIMVPGGGQVLVAGWVTRPGAYGLSPGLTVTGVIIQAGDAMFPADTNSVKVIRAEKGGSKSFIFADLNKIKHGEANDIALQGGDIVEVSAETSKLIPYGLYRFFTSIFNAGVSATYTPGPK